MRYCERCGAAFQSLNRCPRDGIATRTDIVDPMLNRVIGDRYRLLQRVGAGGMGQVYRAAHTRIATLFAIKILYGDIAHDAAMRSRFQSEAESASCLLSRRIVRVVDFGESDRGLLYLVMEYLDGMSLTSLLERERGIAPDRAVGIVRQIARGLAHAHERGVVHRDLKPENVMLVEDDEETDAVKLLDFGIARVRGSAHLTQSGQTVGTPTYMAPEQFLGGEVDGRADLYALGVILYEMLADARPFDADDPVDLALMHRNEIAPPIRDRGPHAPLSPELAAVVHRLLAKNPADRFASASALLDALRSVTATPTSAPIAATPSPAISEPATEAIHAAIRVGAPTYNQGDHAGCFQIYRRTVQDLLGGLLAPAVAPAAAARLRVAMQRADAMESATYAAWEIRYGFDDLLHIAGHTPAAGPGSLARELGIAEELAAPHYVAGHVDLVGDFYLEFIRLLSVQMQSRSENPAFCAWLDKVMAGAEGAGGNDLTVAGGDGVGGRSGR